MAAISKQDYARRLVARKRNARIFYAVCTSAVVIALIMLVALLYSVLSEALAWFNLDGASLQTLFTEGPSSQAVKSGLFPPSSEPFG